MLRIPEYRPAYSDNIVEDFLEFVVSVFLFDAHRVFSSPVTIFGPNVQSGKNIWQISTLQMRGLIQGTIAHGLCLSAKVLSSRTRRASSRAAALLRLAAVEGLAQ